MANKNKNTDIVPLDYGKLPPQAIELEEAVLGAILLEKDALLDVVDIINQYSFYRDEHQKIYEAIISLFISGKPIDILTVPQKLKQLGYLDEIGGISYITGLTSNISSAAHIEYHAKVVQQKFIQRELIRIGSEVQKNSYDDSIDPKDIITKYQSELFSLLINKRSGSKKLSDVGMERLHELQEIQKSGKDVSGVPSGFHSLDRLTSGWQAPDLIIIAARPSMGKTAFALEFAMNAASTNNPVDLYTCEMKDSQIYDRALSRSTGIENSFIRTAQMTPDEWLEIEKAQGIMEKLPIWLDDTPSLNITEFRAKSRRNATKNGTKLIIVDYLQLMKSPEAYKRGGREREVSDISEQLKSTAKELNIPIIALSQLNRSVDSRGGAKKPVLSDLRESGAIEQDADFVAFIHRPEYYGIYEDSKGNSTVNLIEFIIAKHRNGATGEIRLLKNKHFNNISEEERENMFPEPDKKELLNPDKNIEPNNTDNLPF